jgi:DNA-binding NarL/FixJ family response regulator
MGVLIVTGHPITRMGLAQLINNQLDLVVCDEAGTAAKALDALNASKPNLVLSEITLPDKSGLELIKDQDDTSRTTCARYFDARRTVSCRACLAGRCSWLYYET